MNNTCPEIIAIRTEIETLLDRKMKTPSDFDFLSGAIWERMHESLSSTTLKRIWGYIGGADTIRDSTLNILAKVAGHRNWSVFLLQLDAQSDLESKILTNNLIDARNLAMGDRIEVAWSPNRHCVFEHLGACRFKVEGAENSKLKVGDTFDAVFFILGEPLYLDNLCQGLKKPVSYLCGHKKGLIHLRLLLR